MSGAPITNEQRAQRIAAVLATYAESQKDETNAPLAVTEADLAQDLLTDLMHFCDAHGLDFDDLLNLGHMAYLEEAEGQDSKTATPALT